MKSLSRVRLFSTSWTPAYQAPLSMGFSRQEYWSGLPFPSSCTRIPINKCRRNEGNRGSPLEQHSNNHGSQHPLMDGKISGRSLRRNRVFALSKRYLLTTKRKIITEQWKNMADTILSKWLSCISQEEDMWTSGIPSVVKRGPLLPLYFPRRHNLPQMMKKHEINPKWRTFYKTVDQYPSKVSRSQFM